MRYIANIATAVALVSVARAGDAPVVQNDANDATYTATLPVTNGKAISGAVIGSNAPDGSGTNIQVSLYNLPGSGDLSYAIHTGKVSSGDCSTAGGVLDPYGGVTGSQCKNDMAACQVGDLSDKHGAARIISGGSGTGYFPANYVDKYLSTNPGNKAFFGKGSIVVTDSTGAAVACANFQDTVKMSTKGNSTTASSSMAPSMTSGSGSGSDSGSSGSGSDSDSSSSSTSSGMASVQTVAPLLGAGVLGMAALLI